MNVILVPPLHAVLGHEVVAAPHEPHGQGDEHDLPHAAGDRIDGGHQHAGHGEAHEHVGDVDVGMGGS